MSTTDTDRAEARRQLGEWAEQHAAQIMEALAQTAVVYRDVEPIDSEQRWVARYNEIRGLLGADLPPVLTAETLAALASGPAEQCVNKACGEDAAEVIDGDALCTVHAQMHRDQVADRIEAWERDRGAYDVPERDDEIVYAGEDGLEP